MGKAANRGSTPSGAWMTTCSCQVQASACWALRWAGPEGRGADRACREDDANGRFGEGLGCRTQLDDVPNLRGESLLVVDTDVIQHRPGVASDPPLEDDAAWLHTRDGRPARPGQPLKNRALNWTLSELRRLRTAHASSDPTEVPRSLSKCEHVSGSASPIC